MKLFFIGEGERGKTTLLHRLRREHFVEKIDRTEGIDIEDWECRGAKGLFGIQGRNRDPINFLCWDFAGQVSSNSVSMKVKTAQKHRSFAVIPDISYTAGCVSGDSPVLLFLPIALSCSFSSV